MSEKLFELPDICDALDTDGILPSPSNLQYYYDLQERVLWIEGEITDYLTDYEKIILRWNREDKGIPVEKRKPIKIFINSCGGLLDVTMSFVGMVSISKTPVYTINAGNAYSAASIILISGHKRFAMPNTKCLIHSGAGGLGGTYEQTMEQAKEYKNAINRMKNYILERTNISSQLYNRKAPKDWYLDNDDCLKYQIIHHIIDDIDMVL